MKLLILFIAVLGAVKADTSAWTQIRVRFSFSGVLNNVENFFKISNTLSEALADNWVTVPIVNDLGLTTACHSTNVRVCALYDANGFIAGLQIAVPATVAQVAGYPQNLSAMPMFESKTIKAENYFTSTFLVVNPATLSAGERSSFVTLGDGLWYKNGTEYKEVPTSESLITSTTLFNKQNCIPAMGTHYYYNIYPSTRCEDMQPFFVMTKGGNINGIGFQIFGKTTATGRNWYDTVLVPPGMFGRESTAFAIPLADGCYGDWENQFGSISIHTYFVEAPWAITCDQATESVLPITGLLGVVLDNAPKIFNIFDTVRLWLHLY